MLRRLLIPALSSLLIVGAAAAQDPLPALVDLEAGAWSTLMPGGDTMCANGSDYSFFVRPNDPEKLMVYFQGGGACWNDLSCSPAQTFYDRSVEPAASEVGRYGGIFNAQNADNPVSDYSTVFVPYCTGDVHTGSATQTYSGGSGDFDVHFNGFVNAQAVLDWVYANFDSPEQLIVTGSSAGAYGAAFHAPYILEQFPDSNTVVLGDAGLGVSASGFDGLEQWNTFDNVYPGSAEDPLTFNSQLYAYTAANYPEARVAQYSSNLDSVQVFFFTAGGGRPLDWNTLAREYLDELNDGAENFYSYLGWGDSHTILTNRLFYIMQVDGVRFRDWFAGLVNGDASVEDVTCTNCTDEEVYRP